MQKDCPCFLILEEAIKPPEAATAQAHIQASQKPWETKKGKKYISFYGLYATRPLLSAHPWVARLGNDTGVLWSLCKDGAGCTHSVYQQKTNERK